MLVFLQWTGDKDQLSPKITCTINWDDKPSMLAYAKGYLPFRQTAEAHSCNLATVFPSQTTHYARQYMSNGHSANSRMCLSSDWLKVGFWTQGPVAEDTSHRGTIFDQSDARRHLVSWILIVENCSTMRCICCLWTLYPKINIQPIRTCWTPAQIRRMTVGHVSFDWTCIALHSVH